MPYSRTIDLPESVRKNLPAHAQQIYLKTFNHAWEEYASALKRRQSASREVTAHRVAWNAVKRVYRKSGEGWVRKYSASAV